MMTFLSKTVQSGTSFGALLSMVFLASCSSKNKGLPTNLPNITLNSNTATPPHSLPSYSYPFDSRGNYVSAWAAEGEKKAGRSRVATNSDVRNWSSSHGSSSSARRSTSSSSKPKVRVTSTARKKSSASSSRSHTVKRGDTLYGIARRYGSSVAKIKSANGLRSDTIRPGMTLRVPR